MNDIQGYKIKGRHAKLIQAVCIPGNHTVTIVKVVVIGVKEAVKAVCADVLDKKSIVLESGPYPNLMPDHRYWPKTVVRRVPQFNYDVGEVYYKDALASIVTGNDETIANHAFPILHQQYGASVPLLKEYSQILWDLATANGYTTEIASLGLPEGERVYTLFFPKLEVFEQHLLERMPLIYAQASQIVKEDATGLTRAA